MGIEDPTAFEMWGRLASWQSCSALQLQIHKSPRARARGLRE